MDKARKKFGTRAGATHELPDGTEVHIWPDGNYSVDMPNDPNTWQMDSRQDVYRFVSEKQYGTTMKVTRTLKATPAIATLVKSCISQASPFLPSPAEIREKDAQEQRALLASLLGCKPEEVDEKKREHFRREDAKKAEKAETPREEIARLMLEIEDRLVQIRRIVSKL